MNLMLEENPDIYRQLLDDFDFFEDTFLVPYTKESIPLDDKHSMDSFSALDACQAVAEIETINIEEHFPTKEEGNATGYACGSSSVEDALGSTFDENEDIDLDYLLTLLNEGGETEERDGSGSRNEACSESGESVKNWVTKKRLKKGSAEAARRLEEYKIKNRAAALRSNEKKRAYFRLLDLQVKKLRRENSSRKNWLKFFTENQQSRTRRTNTAAERGELRRVVSLSVFDFTANNIE